MLEAVRSAQLVDGWMSDSELTWLAEQAAQKKKIVEVGSWKGKSTKAIAASTTGVVRAVDHWLGSVNDPSLKIAADAGPNAIFNTFLANLRDEVQSGKVIPIKMENAAAAQYLIDTLGVGWADMVFIDSDHGYASVRADIIQFAPLLTGGGLLCGHDYGSMAGGLMKAVDELVPARKLVEGTSIWYATV